ncbi:MAG: hypothetical protein RMA76_25660 [Deltaproteobacteria bacterium]|jgi:hypothetical protein
MSRSVAVGSLSSVRRLMLAVFLVGCSSDIVQIGPPDAKVRDAGESRDGGTPDAGARDAGSHDAGTLEFGCPERITPVVRHVLTDVAPELPARVAYEGGRWFATYGRVAGTSTSVGYVVVEADTIVQDDLLAMDGPIVSGPHLSPISGFGFIAVTRVGSATTGAVHTETWIGDEPPARRSFEWSGYIRLDDAVAMGSSLVLAGTSTDGYAVLDNVTYSGGRSGFGRRSLEPFSPVFETRYAVRGTGRWRFDLQEDFFNPQLQTVFAVPITRDGFGSGWAPATVCGTHVSFDVAAVDRERALIASDCTRLTSLQRQSFAVGDENFGLRRDMEPRVPSRVAHDGSTVYWLQWPDGEDRAVVRAFSESLSETYLEAAAVPTARAGGTPRSADLEVAAGTVDQVAVIATWSSPPRGELLIFEGCGLR